MKVLLVDDDPSILRYLEKWLLDETIEVATVIPENGTYVARIVEMARTQQFDAAFIELLMPGLDGLRLSGEIKRASPHTRIVLMSTPLRPATREQMLLQGVASEFFIEPSVLQELRGVLGIHSCPD